jgi:hypothetical protein
MPSVSDALSPIPCPAKTLSIRGERIKCLSTRNLKMAASAHAYVRGSAALYYEWLEASNGNTLPSGPAVWICGDRHVATWAPVTSANGSLAIQIRDLAAIGDWKLIAAKKRPIPSNPIHGLSRAELWQCRLAARLIKVNIPPLPRRRWRARRV